MLPSTPRWTRGSPPWRLRRQLVQRGGSNDKQKDTFDVYRALKDVVAAERGRFLYSREGKALFWNRHHLLQGGETSVPAFNDTMKDLAYQYAGLDEFKNEVFVVCHPRAVSDSINTSSGSCRQGQGCARRVERDHGQVPGRVGKPDQRQKRDGDRRGVQQGERVD